MSILRPKKTVYHVHAFVPEDVYRWLAGLAKLERKPLNDVVRQLLVKAWMEGDKMDTTRTAPFSWKVEAE